MKFEKLTLLKLFIVLSSLWILASFYIEEGARYAKRVELVDLNHSHMENQISKGEPIEPLRGNDHIGNLTFFGTSLMPVFLLSFIAILTRFIFLFFRRYRKFTGLDVFGCILFFIVFCALTFLGATD